MDDLSVCFALVMIERFNQCYQSAEGHGWILQLSEQHRELQLGSGRIHAEREMGAMLPDEKQEALAEHIQYEIDEFRNSFRDLPGLRRHRHWNRTLESFLLHFRILRGFFLGEGKDPDSDVHASDYISTWRPTKDPIFATTKKAIDKALAHLTLERVTDPKVSNWPDLDRMAAAMETLICEFKKSLSPTQARWFPQLEESRPMFMLGPENNSTVSGPYPPRSIRR